MKFFYEAGANCDHLLMFFLDNFTTGKFEISGIFANPRGGIEIFPDENHKYIEKISLLL